MEGFQLQMYHNLFETKGSELPIEYISPKASQILSGKNWKAANFPIFFLPIFYRII